MRHESLSGRNTRRFRVASLAFALGLTGCGLSDFGGNFNGDRREVTPPRTTLLTEGGPVVDYPREVNDADELVLGLARDRVQSVEALHESVRLRNLVEIFGRSEVPVRTPGAEPFYIVGNRMYPGKKTNSSISVSRFDPTVEPTEERSVRVSYRRLRSDETGKFTDVTKPSGMTFVLSGAPRDVVSFDFPQDDSQRPEIYIRIQGIEFSTLAVREALDEGSITADQAAKEITDITQLSSELTSEFFDDMQNGLPEPTFN